jgi:hypothetical protein
MSDAVQAVMDGMVPALTDLRDTLIFSPTEITALIAKRREFEYLLQRVHARKSDFLLYLSFEMNLLKLYAIRRSKLPKKKPSAGDHHIEQHIHLTFTRAMRKYKADIGMWMQWIDFSKKNDSTRKLGSIYAQALQFHPRSAQLWIDCASWEFFDNNNAKNARVILQRAIRSCANDKKVWSQYFTMELHYIQKMRGRREVLQLDGAMGKKMAESDMFSGKVPLLVYQGAIRAVPDDVAFRLDFLHILRDFPQTEMLETAILDSIERDFSGDTEAWIARAAHALQLGAAQSIAVLRESTEALSHSSDVYNAVFEFLKKMMEDEAVAANVAVIYGEFVADAMRRLSASEMGETLSYSCAEFLVFCNDQESAIDLLKSVCLGDDGDFGEPRSKPESITPMFLLWAGVLLKGGDEDACVDVLEGALRSVDWDLTGSMAYLKLAGMLVDVLLTRTPETYEGLKRVEFIIAASPPAAQRSLAVAYLSHCAVVGGVEGIRHAFKFARSTVAGGDLTEFYELCLSGEVDVQKKRVIYETLLSGRKGHGDYCDSLIERWAKEESEAGNMDFARGVILRRGTR